MINELKKALNRIKGGEISDIFEKLKNDGLLYRCSFSQISRHFLDQFLEINAFQVDFQTLLKTYLEHIKFDKTLKSKANEEILNAIKNEEAFHKYICKFYFNIVTEPREELLEKFMKVSGHIKEIDENLLDLKEQLDGLSTRNQTNEIQEKRPLLLYYKQHNESAKEEILDFIKYEIKDYAINNCYDRTLLGGFLFEFPYSYYWNSKSYKLRYPDDLENKFENLSLDELKKIRNQYKEDKAAFYSFLTNYISDEEVVFSLYELVEKHHLLNIRKEIISEALNTYEHGVKIMFANAVPTIIEGILHDLCLMVGEKENDLLNEGFQQKLDKLQNVFGDQLNYEYYSFRFRLFRNKVAHGRLTKADVDELSDLLLLDLYQICKLVFSDKLRLNYKRFVIDELHKNIFKPNFKYLMEYLLLDKTKILSFYNLEPQIKEIENLIAGKEFWVFLEKEVDKGLSPVEHGIYFILKIISKRKPFDKRCTMLFKKLGIEKGNKEIANHYLKYLTRDF